MTLHYHGTPISPMTALYELAGRHLCVSFAATQDIARAHQIGQSVMLDNGAFSVWKRRLVADWPNYYRWCEQWLAAPTTWAVIPDVIDGGPGVQDSLISEWPFVDRGAPVWHMDEPIERLLLLCDTWPRVCIGSTKQFRVVLSPAWRRLIETVFNEISKRHRFLPWLHMLRGMACSEYPFASLDSTDVARNHNRPQNTPGRMAADWDARQCPSVWHCTDEQMELIA